MKADGKETVDKMSIQERRRERLQTASVRLPPRQADAVQGSDGRTGLGRRETRVLLQCHWSGWAPGAIQTKGRRFTCLLAGC